MPIYSENILVIANKICSYNLVESNLNITKGKSWIIFKMNIIKDSDSLQNILLIDGSVNRDIYVLRIEIITYN